MNEDGVVGEVDGLAVPGLKRVFACSTVFPECSAIFVGVTDADILQQIAEHAAADHSLAPDPGLAAVVAAATWTVPDVIAAALNAPGIPAQRSGRGADHELVARSRREASVELLRSAFDDAPVAAAVTDPSGRVVEANKAMATLLVRSVDELIGFRLMDFVVPGDRDAVEQGRAEMVAGSVRHHRMEVSVVRSDGPPMPVELTCSLVLDASGTARYIVSHLQDITDRRAEQDRLTQAAQVDPLTKLPNRSTFFDELERALVRREARNGVVAVLFCDLDDFKAINDTFGHHAGDAVLAQFADRLRAAKRSTDTAARLSGDEFVVLFENEGLDTAALVRRLQDVLAPPFVVDGRDLRVTASIGVAAAARAGTTATELLRSADQAMYAAKAARRRS